MTRFAQNEREARHVGDIWDQMVAAIGAGSGRIQLLLRSGAIVAGRLTGNRQGGDFPHYFGSLSFLTARFESRWTTDFRTGARTFGTHWIGFERECTPEPGR